MSHHFLKGFPLNWTFGSQNYKKETSFKETERLISFTEVIQRWRCHLGPRSGIQLLRLHKVVSGLLHGPWWYTSIPTDTCGLTPMYYYGKRNLGRLKVQNLMALWCNIGIVFSALGHFLYSSRRVLLLEHLLDEFYGLILQKALDSSSQGLSQCWKHATTFLKKALIVYSEVLIRDYQKCL